MRSRDRGYCQAPGCSRAAVHAHHLHFRSAGGSDDPANLTSLCAAHHLVGVHRGYLRVTGTAPDRLRWEVRALKS
ncbi:MAG TPA: HNH endonuclease [Anaeromyxobacteraceae bacterium]